MDITAVIPVRQGSRRLKNKNVAPFAGTNLLAHKIRQLHRVETISRIVVSSDSPEMLAIATDEGALVHHRPVEYADEFSKTFGEAVEFICRAVEGEHVLWATATSPLVESATYASAIDTYRQALDDGFDSLMTVEVFKRYLWDAEGPVNYGLGTNHVPSQQLPRMHVVTDGVLLAPREKMIEWQYFHGTNPYRLELDKRQSVDIDDGLDLLCARAWLDASASTTPISPFDSERSAEM